jgi:hypothetical protein
VIEYMSASGDGQSGERGSVRTFEPIRPTDAMSSREAGIPCRNEMETGPGGRRIQIDDPDGNPIELFEPVPRR